MNTLIITEAELIIKGDATVQLRISAVGMRHMHPLWRNYNGKQNFAESSSKQTAFLESSKIA
jgi:hypothetical protein